MPARSIPFPLRSAVSTQLHEVRCGFWIEEPMDSAQMEAALYPFHVLGLDPSDLVKDKASGTLTLWIAVGDSTILRMTSVVQVSGAPRGGSCK